MESLTDLRDYIADLETGVSLGFGGLRNEHLHVLAEVQGDVEMNWLETFSMN